MGFIGLRRLLGRPQFHVLIGGLFAGAFFFPFLAITGARRAFWFVHAAWLLSLVFAAILSRGDEDERDADEEVE